MLRSDPGPGSQEAGLGLVPGPGGLGLSLTQHTEVGEGGGFLLCPGRPLPLGEPALEVFIPAW